MSEGQQYFANLQRLGKQAYEIKTVAPRETPVVAPNETPMIAQPNVWIELTKAVAPVIQEGQKANATVVALTIAKDMQAQKWYQKQVDEANARANETGLDKLIKLAIAGGIVWLIIFAWKKGVIQKILQALVENSSIGTSLKEKGAKEQAELQNFMSDLKAKREAGEL